MMFNTKIFNLAKSISMVLGLFFLNIMTSCSSNDEASSSSNSGTNTTTTAFTNATVKPIFDAKCAKCHASGQSNAGNWTYNPSNYETSIKANIAKIYVNTNALTAKMAVSQYGNLTQTEVDAIKTWYNAGYPAN